jgi:hypothetical protein
MLFHLSIDADDPARVARVLAELLGGEAMPLPPTAEGWLAAAGDERGTMVEIYARGTILHEVSGDNDAEGYVDEFARWVRGSSTHFAIGTALTLGQVFAIAIREGWSAKYRRRGGAFGVIEMWIENERMVEVLTADMQAEYVEVMASASRSSTLAKAGGDEQLAA